MSKHPIWSGAVNFGLVSIPVRLFAASRGRDLAFHFLHGKDQGRVKNQRKCSACGEEVPWDEIVRGYEYEKGEYVILSDDDFKRADVEATQSVDIAEFVDASEIDPMMFEKPYWLEPSKPGRHAYALLRDSLVESKKVGVARVVIRAHEHLAIVKPHKEALILELLHFQDEIVPEVEFEFPKAKKDAASAGERKAAAMLIDAMSGTFDPNEFHDKYREELLALIEARAKGKAPATAPIKKRSATAAVDLVAALKKSLEEAAKHRGPGLVRAPRAPAGGRSARKKTKRAA